MTNSLQTEIVLTVVERRTTKLAVKVFLVRGCCACAAVVTADPKVPLFPVLFQSSALTADERRDTEGNTDY